MFLKRGGKKTALLILPEQLAYVNGINKKLRQTMSVS